MQQETAQIQRNFGGRPYKFKSIQEIYDKAELFFKDCDDKKIPYTITGLAIALDTTRETLMDYEDKRPGFSDAIKKVKQICQAYAEQHGWKANNPAFAIFALKNYGWSDKQQVEVTGSLDVGNRLKSARERRKK